MKLRKNEMKLRKKQIEVPKNFFRSSVEDFYIILRHFQFPQRCGLSGGDWLSVAGGRLARGIGAIGAI